jgi:hypothetical protein
LAVANGGIDRDSFSPVHSITRSDD